MEGRDTVRIACGGVFFKHIFLKSGGVGATVGVGQNQRVRDRVIEEHVWKASVDDPCTEHPLSSFSRTTACSESGGFAAETYSIHQVLT